jgi:hypothetical protein
MRMRGAPGLSIKILEKCKIGATKKDIITKDLQFPISNVQFRRSTAELVDRRLLRYDEEQNVYHYR